MGHVGSLQYLPTDGRCKVSVVPRRGAFAQASLPAKSPGLGGATDHEIKTIYKAIKQQLASADLEPDRKQAGRGLKLIWPRGLL